MNWEDALGAAIEVAIAIAGFAGIVAAFNRRNECAWTATDQLLLQMLLTASAISCIFAFLPFVMLDVLDDRAAWRIGSVLQVVWVAGIAAYRIRQSARTGAEYVDSTAWIGPIVLASAVVQAVNAAWWGEAWPYVLGVAIMIAVGFAAFIRLLLGNWKV